MKCQSVRSEEIKKELYAYIDTILGVSTVGDKNQTLFCSIDFNDIEKTLNAWRDPKDLTPFKDVLKKGIVTSVTKALLLLVL